MYDLTRAGQLDEAMRLQFRVSNYSTRSSFAADFPEGVRTAVELRGFQAGRCRTPQTDRQQLDRAGLPEDAPLYSRPSSAASMFRPAAVPRARETLIRIGFPTSPPRSSPSCSAAAPSERAAGHRRRTAGSPGVARRLSAAPRTGLIWLPALHPLATLSTAGYDCCFCVSAP